jgi:RNA polymerase sigma-70 factor (ECF subfamily)
MDPPPDRTSPTRFPSTHWSRVVAASGRATPDDREALAELCRAYWYPLYAFIRRNGFSPEDAQDLTQAYFTRLLQTGVLAAATRRRAASARS